MAADSNTNAGAGNPIAAAGNAIAGAGNIIASASNPVAGAGNIIASAGNPIAGARNIAHAGMTADSHEERFLAKLRARLVTSARPAHPGSKPPHEPAGAPDVHRLVQRFAQELAAVGGRAEYCATPDELASRLGAACREAGAATVVLEADPRWALPGMAPWRRALDRIGCELIVPDSERRPRDVAVHADAGLTIADFAIADTGTVGLWTGPGRARVVSLLPPVHLVLLPADALLARRGEALRRMAAKAEGEGLPSQVMLITGPSRTGDIEGELTVGVHGPGKVFVFIVETGGTAQPGINQ